MKKKPYIKPEVFVENFLISESIANCDTMVTAADRMCLPADIVDGSDPDDIMGNVFITDWNGCDMKATEGEDYNGYCYHTLDGSVIFTS